MPSLEPKKQHSPDSPAEQAESCLNAETVILDTETTGLADTDQIIEIAVVSGTGEVLLNTRVKPTVAINPHAQAVHGISISDLKDAPSWREIHDKFCKLIAGKRVVAFNADFDIRMIQQSSAAFGLSVDLPNTSCAMELAAHKYGGNYYGSISLRNAVAEAGISFQGEAHTALGDTLTTLALIQKIAE